MYPTGYVPKHHRVAGTQAGSMSPLGATALLTMFIPGVGDVTGFAADMEEFAKNPESRTWRNYLLSAAGTLPGVPNMALFLGAGARMAAKSQFDKAMDMADQGADRQRIWDETGLFQGAEGGWRFEKPDDRMGFHPTYELDGTPVRAGHVGGAVTHPELFQAYPDLQTIPFNQSAPAGGGQYLAPPMERLSVGPHPLPGRQADVAVHELQHAIQQREGFAPGTSAQAAWMAADHPNVARVHEIDEQLRAMDAPGEFNPDLARALRQERMALTAGGPDADALYRRYAGEVEARNAARRRLMTLQQRQARPPWATEDIPRAQQIIAPGATGLGLLGGRSQALPF